MAFNVLWRITLAWNIPSVVQITTWDLKLFPDSNP
jgi:hypothetical protein